MDNKVLVILGMHRSGTSLVSQWLYQCRLNLGYRLLGKGIGNEEGHFEDLDFLDLHEQILIDNNFDSRGIINVGELEVNDYFKYKLKNLIELKCSLNKQWGWKEPRTCLFIEHYDKIIPDSNYLIVYRDADSVVNSLLKRDIKNEERKLKLEGWRKRIYLNCNRKKIHKNIIEKYTEPYFYAWLNYNKKIKNIIANKKTNQYRVVHYETLINMDYNISNWLKDEGFEIKYLPFSNVFREDMIFKSIDKFKIKPPLREKIDEVEYFFKAILSSVN